MSHGLRQSTVEHGGLATTERAEPLLKPEAVAELLACSPKTVYAWASSGLLPSVRLGRLVRFRPEDVRRFVEANTEGREDAIHGSGLP